jgi:hypothetical protein
MSHTELHGQGCAMIPAGYLLKRVAPPPGWLPGPHIIDVCSVSDCVNENVVELQKSWLHNGFGLANDPQMLMQAGLSGEEGEDAVLFYYEVFEQEIESDGWSVDPTCWRPVSTLRSASIENRVEVPDAGAAELLGYDVVVSNDFLEHSPLSCNSVASELGANAHCLFDTFEQAKRAINEGGFGGGCEDGTYRIMSVSLIVPT